MAQSVTWISILTFFEKQVLWVYCSGALFLETCWIPFYLTHSLHHSNLLSFSLSVCPSVSQIISVLLLLNLSLSPYRYIYIVSYTSLFIFLSISWNPSIILKLFLPTFFLGLSTKTTFFPFLNISILNQNSLNT